MNRLAVMTFIAITACANPKRDASYATTPVPVEQAGGFNCAAEGVQYAIGQKTNVELGGKLVAESGSRTLRWLPPRSAATMDYREDRLNIAYDDEMVITRINCG